MRILVLSNIPPASVGGAEVQAFNLSKCWSQQGHEVTVAGYANENRVINNLKIVKIPMISAGRVIRALSFSISTLLFLWRNQKKFDLIYCRFLKEQTFIASFAKSIFRLKQPLIACPACASTGGEVEHILNSTFKKLWIKLLQKNVSVINAMSSQIKDEVLSLGISESRISSIPNGVFINQITPIKTTHQQPVKLIFVGRLVEQKGLDILIRALHLIKNKQLSFTLKIIGYGPLEMSLKKECEKLSLNKHIEFVGKVSPDKIPNYLAEADLFILPSFFEGFPGALLEAIANGLPAIATKVSGSEEIIDKEIGWLTEIGDFQSLAVVLEQAIELDREKLVAMGSSARNKAIEHFAMGKIASRYLELFQQSLSLKETTTDK